MQKSKVKTKFGMAQVEPTESDPNMLRVVFENRIALRGNSLKSTTWLVPKKVFEADYLVTGEPMAQVERGNG